MCTTISNYHLHHPTNTSAVDDPANSITRQVLTTLTRQGGRFLNVPN